MATATVHPNQLSLFVVQEAVSKSALLAFRTITNLARRTGKGFVKCFPTLAAMLGVSERRAWQLIAELKAAGWISWNPIRDRGQRGIEFAPLVKLPKQSRGRFAPRAGRISEPSLPVVGGAFSCPKSAPSIALSNAKSCTLDRGTPLKTSPVGTEDDNSEGANLQRRTSAENETLTESPEAAVAVSLLENVVSSHEAQELAREATRKQLTKEQIERVIAAYRSQQEKIRNRGAWLREAIRRGFTPAAPATRHASDLAGTAPIAKIVKVPALPTVQPGQELLDAKRDPKLLKIMQKCSSLAKGTK